MALWDNGDRRGVTPHLDQYGNPIPPTFEDLITNMVKCWPSKLRAYLRSQERNYFHRLETVDKMIIIEEETSKKEYLVWGRYHFRALAKNDPYLPFYEQKFSHFVIGIPQYDITSGSRQPPTQPIALDCPPILMNLTDYSYGQEIFFINKTLYDNPTPPEKYSVAILRRAFEHEHHPNADYGANLFFRFMNNAETPFFPISKMPFPELRPVIKGKMMSAHLDNQTGERYWRYIYPADTNNLNLPTFEYHYETHAWYNQEKGVAKPYHGTIADKRPRVLRLNCARPYDFYIVGNIDAITPARGTVWLHDFFMKFQEWYARGPAHSTKYLSTPLLEERWAMP